MRSEFKTSIPNYESSGMPEDYGYKTDKELKKELGRLELLYLSLGGIIGSGWLLSPLYASSYAGSLSILAWIVAGLLVLPIGIVYALISSNIPRSGGIVRYPHYSHGGFVGFLMAWAYFLTALSTVPTEAIATVQYLSYFIPSLYYNGSLTDMGYTVVIILLGIYFMINYLGIRVLGKVTHAVGWWKLLIPSATAIILLTLSFHPRNFTLGVTMSYSSFLYAIPASGIIYSYLGFRQAIEYGGEGKNPKKDIKFAVLGSLLTAMTLYILLQISFIGALDWNNIEYSNGKLITPGNWTALPYSNIATAPFISLISLGVISLVSIVFTYILFLDAIISPSGTGWIYLGSTARALYGFSTNGYMPDIFMKLNKTKVPIVSLIVSVLAGLIFLLPFPTWQQIVAYNTSTTVFTYLMGGITLGVMNNKSKSAKVIAPLATVAAGLIAYWSGFRTIFFVILTILIALPFFLMYYATKTLKLRRDYAIYLSALNIVGISLVGYIFLQSTNFATIPNTSAFLLLILGLISIISIDIVTLQEETKCDEIKAGIWLPVYMIITLIISYYGPLGLSPIIQFPIYTIAIALVTLAFHYLAVNSSKSLNRTSDLSLITEV